MAISKVIYGGETLVDLTDSTVTASSLTEGVVAYSADGERIVGEAVIPTKTSQLENDSGYIQTTDSRLSNARTPLAHTHSSTEVTYGETLSFTIKKNVYINTNGAEIGYSGWDDTDYIDISGHDRIFCNVNNQWCAWYKDDKTFLSNANFSNKTYLDVPTSAKYLRVSGTASAINSLSISTSAETVSSIIARKQDKLTAGTGITIADNVISAGGDSGNPYTETDIDNMFIQAHLYDWEEGTYSGIEIGGGDDGGVIVIPDL